MRHQIGFYKDLRNITLNTKIKSFETNHTYIHLRTCDDASSCHCSYPIAGSKNPKWDWVLNCCAECPTTKAQYL